jgi:hypothetical protein
MHALAASLSTLHYQYFNPDFITLPCNSLPSSLVPCRHFQPLESQPFAQVITRRDPSHPLSFHARPSGLAINTTINILIRTSLHCLATHCHHHWFLADISNLLHYNPSHKSSPGVTPQTHFLFMRAPAASLSTLHYQYLDPDFITLPCNSLPLFTSIFFMIPLLKLEHAVFYLY